MNFTNKVVLLTGAASGIGAATAVKFSELGAKLAIVDRSKEGLKKTAENCLKHAKSKDQGEILQLVGDVSQPEDLECIAKQTIDKYKRLDVLVNNAGIMEDGTIENTSLKQFDCMIHTNLRSQFYLTLLLVPELLKTKGNIVNTSSICGMRSFPNTLAYNISKSGVDQFTRCVALELGERGVRCNCINPGVIYTNLQKRYLDEKAYEEFIKKAKHTHALARYGQPVEVANVICFLASDLASFITGHSVPVDGGRHAMTPR
ncbi:3-oxoacyl-[acyl-carrier-protein] reductase FabG-like [Anastrepha obliqua]|uniref:3-oxoacyl-[acyl-carrier-protein] reductase FabG-like n=1 Tax=Anastrepha obliqua TaxID=95512 RepID=UPI00240A2413|nr:3-oxoacyl-[acyl-carrier-protein] reductase FabG-like [Anastrepha obliqua]